MVVHHVIRCCCIFIPSTAAVLSGPSQSQIDHILASCPPDIRAANETYLLLYVFVVHNNRLPRPEENFLNKKLGEWVVRVRANENSGKITAQERAALNKMPLWLPLQRTQPAAACTSEKSALLRNNF
jgi:hypothetical protein